MEEVPRGEDGLSSAVLMDYAMINNRWGDGLYNLIKFRDKMEEIYLGQEKHMKLSRYVASKGIFKGWLLPVEHPAKKADDEDKELFEDIFLKTVKFFAPALEERRRKKKQEKRKERKQKKAVEENNASKENDVNENDPDVSNESESVPDSFFVV